MARDLLVIRRLVCFPSMLPLTPAFSPPPLLSLCPISHQVDQRVFDNLLHPHLSLAGFLGRFKPKCGTTPEGCATFVRRDRFEIVEDLSFNLKEALAAEDGEFAVRGPFLFSLIRRLRFAHHLNLATLSLSYTPYIYD